MSLKTIIILYWVIMLSFVIGVYIQKDENAHNNALIWLCVSIGIFLLGAFIKRYRDKHHIE